MAVHIRPILFPFPQFYVLFHIPKMHAKIYGFKYKPAVQVQAEIVHESCGLPLFLNPNTV